MKKVLYWLPSIFFAVLIFGVSGMTYPPGIRFLEFLPNSDKIVHMTEYFVFAWLVYSAFLKTSSNKGFNAVLLTLLVVSLYGVSDEIHQYFVPGRSCDILDWAADTAGAALLLMGQMAEEISQIKKAQSV